MKSESLKKIRNIYSHICLIRHFINQAFKSSIVNIQKFKHFQCKFMVNTKSKFRLDFKDIFPDLTEVMHKDQGFGF